MQKTSEAVIMTSLVFFYNEKEARISDSFVIIFSYSHVQILKPVTGKYESHGQNPIVLYATVHKSRYYLHGWIPDVFFSTFTSKTCSLASMTFIILYFLKWRLFMT